MEGGKGFSNHKEDMINHALAPYMVSRSSSCSW